MIQALARGLPAPNTASPDKLAPAGMHRPIATWWCSPPCSAATFRAAQAAEIDRRVTSTAGASAAAERRPWRHLAAKPRTRLARCGSGKREAKRTGFARKDGQLRNGRY
jgi:hypothetical protein